jgi:hypothetical protein
MILVNDGLLSLNLNESQESDEEFTNLFKGNSKIEHLKLGKYWLVDMLKQFWVTCSNTYSNISSKIPYISIVLQRLSNNPFEESHRKAILLLMVRQFKPKFEKERRQFESKRRKNWNSMPIETQESKWSSISYPLYPDNMNHAAVLFKDVPITILHSLYFAILCQQKIVIVYSKVQKISLIVESMFKLVYPLDTTSYTTIGFINERVTEFACAPIPVIVGCHPSVYHNIPTYELAHFESEVVILNIDQGTVKWKQPLYIQAIRYSEDTNWKTSSQRQYNNMAAPLWKTHQIPSGQSPRIEHHHLLWPPAWLGDHLWMANKNKLNVNMLEEKIREIREMVNKKKEFLIDGYLDVNDDSSRNIKLQVMANLEINMKIKRIFVNFMIQILGNYQSFYTKDGEFDYQGYIDQISPENKAFYECFTKTQMFNTFLKDSWLDQKLEIQEFKNYLTIIHATNKSPPIAAKAGDKSSGE